VCEDLGCDFPCLREGYYVFRCGGGGFESVSEENGGL